MEHHLTIGYIGDISNSGLIRGERPITSESTFSKTDLSHIEHELSHAFQRGAGITAHHQKIWQQLPESLPESSTLLIFIDSIQKNGQLLEEDLVIFKYAEKIAAEHGANFGIIHDLTDNELEILKATELDTTNTIHIEDLRKNASNASEFLYQIAISNRSLA